MYFEIIITISNQYQRKKRKEKSTKIPSEKSVKKRKRKKNSPGIHKIDLLLLQEQPHVIIEWLLEFALLSQQLPIVDFVSQRRLPSKVIQVIHKCMIVAHFKFFQHSISSIFYIFLFFLFFRSHNQPKHIKRELRVN